MFKKIQAIVSIVLLLGLGAWFADQQGWFDWASSPAPAAAPPPPPLPPAAEGKAPADRAAGEGKGPVDRTAGDPLPPAVPASPAAAESPPPPVQGPPMLPPPDPAYDAHFAKMRELQMTSALQALEASVVGQQVQIAEARLKLLETERKRRQAEQPDPLPPVAPPPGSRGPVAAAPVEPPPPPVPVFAVVAIRQSIDGAFGATVLVDAARTDVRVGSVLVDGWTVAAIDERGVRFEKAAGRGRPLTRTATFAQGQSAAAGGAGAPLPPLNLGAPQALQPPLPGTPIPGMPGALYPQAAQ